MLFESILDDMFH